VGHSLGGALAVFAAVHLKQNFDPYGFQLTLELESLIKYENKIYKTLYIWGAASWCESTLSLQNQLNNFLKNQVFSDYINLTFGENAYRGKNCQVYSEFNI
jgi:hypothetical protein